MGLPTLKSLRPALSYRLGLGSLGLLCTYPIDLGGFNNLNHFLSILNKLVYSAVLKSTRRYPAWNYNADNPAGVLQAHK